MNILRTKLSRSSVIQIRYLEPVSRLYKEVKMKLILWQTETKSGTMLSFTEYYSDYKRDEDERQEGNSNIAVAIVDISVDPLRFEVDSRTVLQDLLIDAEFWV